MSASLAACAAAAVAAGGAHAQEPSDEPQEVIISTRRLEETLPEELARYGVRVTTITSKQVQDGGFNDVSQTLQSLADGLYIAPRAGAFDYVDLSYQGSRTGDVLWLIDGVRLNNRLYNTTTPIDTIPAHMIERIELMDGGQSLFYGTQAVAGAVNIVTRDFAEEPDGAIELGLDTNEGKHANGYFRTALGRNRIVVHGSSDEADGFRPFRESDIQPSATDRERGYDVQTYGLKYAFDTERVRFSANYQHTDAKLDHAQPKFIASATNTRDEDILSAKLDYRASEQLQFYVKGYYHWWDAFYNETDTVEGGPPEVISDDEFWGFTDYGVNVLGKFASSGGVDYFLGYDFQRYNGQDDVLLIARDSETVQAPFAQIRTTPQLWKTVRLAAGVRYNEPDSGEAATVWNVSGQWDVSPTLFVRGTVGTAFRLPDAYELFAIDPCCEAGNPNLKPEKSENLNISIGGEIEAAASTWNWELIGFARDITDLITIVFDEARGIDTFANEPDKVRVRGGQFVLRGRFPNGFSARGSASFTGAERTGSDAQIQDIPESLAKLALDYSPDGRPFGVTLTVNAVGNIHRNLGVGRVSFGNYEGVDLAARWFLDAHRRHRIGLRLENAFDQEYATRVRQTTPDGGGDPYAYWHVGTPQTLHATYSYRFGR